MTEENFIRARALRAELRKCREVFAHLKDGCFIYLERNGKTMRVDDDGDDVRNILIDLYEKKITDLEKEFEVL